MPSHLCVFTHDCQYIHSSFLISMFIVGSSTLVTKESKNSSFQPFPATSSEGDVPAFDECDESFEPDQK